MKAKTKCATECPTNASKGLNPYSDCYTPYRGATSECVDDTVLDKKGAEDKFRDAIRKACDPTFKDGTDCSECYGSGDCTTAGEAGDRVQSIENQVDSFGPGVFCEQTPAADLLEFKCELGTAMVLAKLVGSINTCYEKCYVGARKVPPRNEDTDCIPPGAGLTAACVSAAEAKSIAGVDKKCGAIGVHPDCGTGTDNYPNGASWTNLVSISIAGNVPGTFCDD